MVGVFFFSSYKPTNGPIYFQLDIIEYMHSKGALFNDIKPNNFAIGAQEPMKIFIFDFGLSKFYMKNGTHVQADNHGKGPGTGKYLSLYAHTHFTLSRRDDVESICYMLIEFVNGNLWGGRTDMDEIYRQKSTYGLQVCNLFIMS